jgi:hypothetical protein
VEEEEGKARERAHHMGVVGCGMDGQDLLPREGKAVKREVAGSRLPGVTRESRFFHTNREGPLYSLCTVGSEMRKILVLE